MFVFVTFCAALCSLLCLKTQDIHQIDSLGKKKKRTRSLVVLLFIGHSFIQGFVLYAADPGASDDDDKELESLSAGSQSTTRCPAVSTDSDPTVAGLDLSSLKGITGNFYGSKQFSPKNYSDTRAQCTFLADQYLIFSALICCHL